MPLKYKGLYWTNHSLKRLNERSISKKAAWATWHNPDNSRYAKSKGVWIFYKTLNDRKIEVVANKNLKGDWVIISVWSDFIEEKEKKVSLFYKLFRSLFKLKK